MKKAIFLLLVLVFLTNAITFSQTITNKLETTGNVGAGTISPLSRLHVRGTNHSSYGLLALQDSVNSGTTGQAYLTFLGANGSRLSYLGAYNGNFLLSNDQASNFVSISPFGGKVSIGAMTNYSQTLQVHGSTYLRDNVGIGTTAPVTKLEVKGAIFSSNNSTSTGVYFSADDGPFGLLQASDHLNSNTIIRHLALQLNGGNVGIGTSNPKNKLDIAAGPLGIRGGNSLYFYAKDDSTFSQMFTDSLRNLTFRAGNNGVFFQAAAKIGLQTFSNGSYNDKITILNGGNVGIGVTTPQEKLTVDGTVLASKVRVKQNVWADYVFEPAYKLPALQEVEAFIRRHKHLPDVPSASQVGKEGLDVGENQALLLKKIEELTLYIIEINKKVDSQQETIERQSMLVNKQQQLISQLLKGLTKK